MHVKLEEIRIFINILILNCKLQLNKAARDQDKMNFTRGVDKNMSKFGSNKPLMSSWKCLSHGGPFSLSVFDIFLIKWEFFSPSEVAALLLCSRILDVSACWLNLQNVPLHHAEYFHSDPSEHKLQKCAFTSKGEVSPGLEERKGRKTKKKPKKPPKKRIFRRINVSRQ